jgi:transcriptional regulator with XRE-family HTH domain
MTGAEIRLSLYRTEQMSRRPSVSDKRLYYLIGRMIRLARIEQHMTQSELGKWTKLGRTSIVNIENGVQAIQLDTLYLVARALSKDVRDFLPPDDLLLLESDPIYKTPTLDQRLKSILEIYS